jgi:hypothetical protein
MAFRTIHQRRTNVAFRNDGIVRGVDFGDAYATATFNSVNVYLPFVRQGGVVAQTATLEYRTPAGAGDWVAWFPAEKTESSVWGGLLSGSVTLLTHNTEYEFRITAQATGGQHQVTVTQSTKEDAIETHATLLARATHFVRLDGDDANAGTADTDVGAWRTLRKAHQAAPTGAVVKVGTGTADEFFEWSGAVPTNPLRQEQGGVLFVAPFPPVDDDGELIAGNIGKRTFIEGNVRGAPTGVTLDGHVTAPWSEVVLTGPLTGDAVTVWKWTGAKLATDRLNAMCYGATRAEDMRVMWHWDWQTFGDQAPEYWAEFAQGGDDKLQISWHYGYYYTSTGTDLFMLMPPDELGAAQDPNDFYWTTHGGDGFSLACPDSRVSGFVVRAGQNGVYANQRADRLIVDHNWFQNVYTGIRTQGQVASSGSPYSSDIVAEANRITMRGLRRPPGLTQDEEPVAPWGWVKQFCFLTARGIAYLPTSLQTVQSGGPNNGKTFYNRTRQGGRMEGTGMLNTGSRRTVFRHNIVDGLFNGFGAEVTGGTTQYTEDMFSNAESDCHDNIFRNLPDDAWEPAHACPNVKFWDNRVEYAISGMSTGGPTAWGPLYMFRNTFWRVSCSTGFGMQPMEDGANSLRRGDQNAYWFKYDGAANAQRPQARIYVVHNTFWSDDPRAHGGEPAAGAGSLGQKFYKRNNIIRVYIDFMDFFGPARGGYDEDYNAMAAELATARLRRNPSNASEATVIYATLAAYQAGTGMGTNSNTTLTDLFDVVTLDAQLTDPTAGDLTLAIASDFIGIGVNTPLAPSGAVDLGATP